MHDDCLASYRDTGERKIIGIGREVVGRRKDGSFVSLDLSVAEWRDVDGEHCFTGIMRDVTVRNQQARDLQRATEIAEQARIEAEAANSAKTEFLAAMSHEIRTPLTSIYGFTDLLSRRGRLNREQRRYLNLIRTANEALLTIVNDILDFSKVEAGQLQLQNHAFSLSALIHDAATIVQPAAAKKSLVLKWTLDRHMPEWLLGDDSRLRQILFNLLNNAIKFTEAGSISVTFVRSCPTARSSSISPSLTQESGFLLNSSTGCSNDSHKPTDRSAGVSAEPVSALPSVSTSSTSWAGKSA
jgi:signal transduction histidine kinase